MRPVQPTTYTLVQAARFVAAALVLFRHSELVFGLPKYFDYHPLHGAFNGGNLGVDFFFVLSGFIILHAHWNDVGKPSKLIGYLKKRAFRIYPAYWIAALLTLAPLYFMPSRFAELVASPAYLIGQFLLLPSDNSFVEVAWSLQHEMMFYVMFAVLIWNRAAGMVAMGAWFIASATVSGAAAPSADLIGDPRHLQFLLGMAAAFITRYHAIPSPRALLALGVVAFSVCFYVGGLGYGDLAVPGAPNLTLTVGLASAMILCALVELEKSRGWRAPGWLRFSGDASYSIYLVHLPLLTLYVRIIYARHLEASVPLPVLFAIGLVIGVVSGLLFYALVERPIQRSLKKQTAAAPVPALQPAQ
ncbi:MAG: acyltransferase [Tardiphaga sp.]